MLSDLEQQPVDREKRESLKLLVAASILAGTAMVGGTTGYAFRKQIANLLNLRENGSKASGKNRPGLGVGAEMEATSTDTQEPTEVRPTSTPTLEAKVIINKESEPIEPAILELRWRKGEDGVHSVQAVGEGPIIPDSVFPGGIMVKSTENEREAQDQAIFRLIYVHNGRVPDEVLNIIPEDSPNTLNERLKASRVYAESAFGVKGYIDTETLHRGDIRTENDTTLQLQIGDKFYQFAGDYYYTAWSKCGNFQTTMYAVHAPNDYRYDQIAVRDEDTNTTFINTSQPIDGEVLYVVVTKNKEGDYVNTITYRGACGNIGKEEDKIPLPTPTIVVTPSPTPEETPAKEATVTVTVTPTPSSTSTPPPPTDTPTPSPDTATPPPDTATPPPDTATPPPDTTTPPPNTPTIPPTATPQGPEPTATFEATPVGTRTPVPTATATSPPPAPPAPPTFTPPPHPTSTPLSAPTAGVRGRGTIAGQTAPSEKPADKMTRRDFFTRWGRQNR